MSRGIEKPPGPRAFRQSAPPFATRREEWRDAAVGGRAAGPPP